MSLMYALFYLLFFVGVLMFINAEDNSPVLWGIVALFFTPLTALIIYLVVTRLGVVEYRSVL